MSARAQRPQALDRRGGRERDVLELVGDDVDGRSERLKLAEIIEGAECRGSRNLAGGAGLVIVDVALEAEACGAQRQHAPELAAAQDADCGARRERLHRQRLKRP